MNFTLTAFASILLAAGAAHGALLAHYTFDETSGTTAFDSSGNGLHGTIAGGAIGTEGAITSVAGISGNALQFSDDSHLITISSTDWGEGENLKVANGFTISTWLNWTDSTRNRGAALTFTQLGSGNRSVDLGVGGGVNAHGSVYARVRRGNSINDTSPNTASNPPNGGFNTGDWQHVVGVFTSTGISVFVNGELVDSWSGTTLTTNSLDLLTIGAYRADSVSSTTSHFIGAIDDIQIYNVALNEDQIAFLRDNPGSILPGPTDELKISAFANVDTDTWEATLRAAPLTPYQFISAPDLDFSDGTLVQGLSQGDPGDPGTIGGDGDSTVTTDIAGIATVRMTLTGPKNFIRAQEMPPLLSESFDADGPGLPAGWIGSKDPGTAGTDWQVGDPSFLPGLADGNGTNAVGTNVAGLYADEDATITLTSPAIAVPAGGATLSFIQYIDSNAANGEAGAVRLLDATDTEIAEGAFPVTGIDGVEAGWTFQTFPLPPSAAGQSVKLVFEFTTAASGAAYHGFYIDDVVVTAD